MKRMRMLLTLLLTGALLVLSACSGPQVRSVSPEDTPEHHYLSGMNALEGGKIDVAQEKFERAVFLDERFAKGYAGLAIVGAEKVKAQKDPAFQQVEGERVEKNLKKAAKYAEKPDEEFDCAVARIRVATLMKQKGWLGEAEDAYHDGAKLKVDEQTLTYYRGTEALSYFLGAAYLEALEFQKARDSFAAVLNAKREGKWNERADRGWKKTDRIVRALAGMTVGDAGKKIAVQDRVSRADLAALLVDEMQLEKLFAGRIPAASQLAKQQAEFTPADLGVSPFKQEVLTVMKWKVRGLEPKYDEGSRAYLYFPGDHVNRGEMAFILEDVLIKLTNNEKLATAYFGQDKSPFPDVRATSPFYNAVMNMTTRGIMEGELSGEFRVADPVEGSEALLAIRMLKQRINTY